MINHHNPLDWKYEGNGMTFIKVGAYGMDDLEYIEKNNSVVYLPEVNRLYPNVEDAYQKENKLWIEIEDSYEEKR